MKPFIEFAVLLRELICVWAILLIFGCILNGILSVRQRHTAHVAAALAAFLVNHFIVSVCQEISAWKPGENLHPLLESIGDLPYAVFLAILALLTVAFIVHFRLNETYSRTHITDASVKEAVDLNPTGLCYYLASGQPVLTNYRMNEICFFVTGRALLNALKFCEEIQGRSVCELPDGTVVRFSHKEFLCDGEPFHELIADDITEFYRKSETLRQENERLRLQNERMKEYGKIIDETVRRQKILNSKTHIHDEMNRLLLSTDNAIREGSEVEKENILETWPQNILLLYMEADTGVKSNALSDLDALAKNIGVAIRYDKLPETENADTLRLFSLAAEEAMTNAVKHGGAKNLYIQISEENELLTAVFTNDGEPSAAAFVEGGGLSSLRQCIETAGGTMQIVSGERITLTVAIPKKGNRNVV